MIMQSGRSSGGGGGSNRDVVFTGRFQMDPRAARELSAFAKQVDDVAKKLNMTGNFGGAASGRGGYANGAGGAASGNGGRAAAPRSDTWDQRAQERDAAAVGREYNREMARRRREEAAAIKAEDRYQRQQEAFWNRAAGQEQRGKAVNRGSAGPSGPLVTRGQFGEALEGVTSLARAVAFLGASSEDSAKKMLRQVLVFEAFAQATRGGMKIAEPLGAVLGAGASKMGLAAGASTGWLGAAGLAAGIGIAGGGMAIADQIRYSRTGQIGGFSQTQADWGTKIARWGIENTPEQFRMALPFVSPIAGVYKLSGAYDAYGQRARGDMALEARIPNDLAFAGQDLRYNQAKLGAARNDLSEQERGLRTKQSAASAYGSLDPFDQAMVRRLRDKWLKDPNSLSDRQLSRVAPWLGADEQARVSKQQVERAGGLFDRGFEREKGVTFDSVKTQREVVLTLKMENDSLIEKIDNLMRDAIAIGNEDLDKKIEKLQQQLQADLSRLDRNAANANQAVVNSYGVP